MGKRYVLFLSFHWSVDIDAVLFISHHSVFFTTSKLSRKLNLRCVLIIYSSEGDRKGNCHPGLVVENEVTGPMKNDFYLQSNAALRGSKLSIIRILTY